MMSVGFESNILKKKARDYGLWFFEYLNSRCRCEVVPEAMFEMWQHLYRSMQLPLFGYVETGSESSRVGRTISALVACFKKISVQRHAIQWQNPPTVFALKIFSTTSTRLSSHLYVHERECCKPSTAGGIALSWTGAGQAKPASARARSIRKSCRQAHLVNKILIYSVGR
jgi:hypothetical protein